MFLESLTETLRALEELIYTSHDTAFFLGVDLCGGEVVDAILETLLDKVGVHLFEKYNQDRCHYISEVLSWPYVHELRHLLLLHAHLQLALFLLVESTSWSAFDAFWVDRPQYYPSIVICVLALYEMGI